MKKNRLSFLLLLVLGVIAIYFYSKNDSSVSSKSLNNFAIEDTASITKLFLADNDGNSSTLTKRSDGTWEVNGKFKARPQNIYLILRGLHNFEVKSTVPKEAVPAIIKQIASKPIKLEVYQGSSKPSKIYYFGFATQDHYGNYALLEIPGEGKSKEPYIIKEKGFHGFIRPRMITMEKDWRSSEIFYYPNLSINTIKVDYPDFPEESFQIEWEGKNNIHLKDIEGNPFSRFDTLAVKNYMLNYKEVYIETYNNRLSDVQADSVINSTIPRAFISIKDNSGMEKTIAAYNKGFVDPFLREGDYGNVDEERLYILNGKKELAIAQRLQWDPLFIPLSYFNAK
jgi:hypothetical protein